MYCIAYSYLSQTFLLSITRPLQAGSGDKTDPWGGGYQLEIQKMLVMHN